VRQAPLEAADVRQYERPLDIYRAQQQIVDPWFGIAVGIEHRIVCCFLRDSHRRIASPGHVTSTSIQLLGSADSGLLPSSLNTRPRP
jgi:hypothetical protein